MDDGNLPDFEYLGEQRLDPFADSKRRMPSDIVRSSLFNVRNKNRKREFLQEVKLPSTGSTVIEYTGADLRQDDALVWYQIINIAKNSPLGNEIGFSAYEFCRAIGWSICGKSYSRLRSCLTRMQATALKIYSKEHHTGISLSLITSFRWKDEMGEPLTHYTITLPQELILLFGQHNFTQIEWSQRLKLSDGLASWLHSFYSSHKEPFDMMLETLQKLSGSESSPKEFKRAIAQALNELVEIRFLKAWEFVGESKKKLHIERAFAKPVVPMPLEMSKMLGRLPEDLN